VPLPDGRILLATAGADEVVRLWDPATLTLAGELPGHFGSIQAACPVPLPDGRTLLATADDGTLCVWHPSDPVGRREA
jgi:WD40 repeat protein